MSWSGIESWARTNAPALHAAFLPPSSGADIAAAEEVLGLPLPADLVAWWRQFGGIGDRYRHWALIPPHWQPHGLSRALHYRTLMIDAIRGIAFSSPEEERAFEATALQEPAGTPCPDLWLPAWLPVAADGCGYELFADLREGPQRGCVMEWGKYDGAATEPLWPNVDAMFDDTLRALEGHGRYRVEIESDYLSWE